MQRPRHVWTYRGLFSGDWMLCRADDGQSRSTRSRQVRKGIGRRIGCQRRHLRLPASRREDSCLLWCVAHICDGVRGAERPYGAMDRHPGVREGVEGFGAAHASHRLVRVAAEGVAQLHA